LFKSRIRITIESERTIRRSILVLNERRQGIITIVVDILVDHPGNSSILVKLWDRLPVEWKAGKAVSLVWLEGIPEGKVIRKLHGLTA
jgi:hypothetical protein